MSWREGVPALLGTQMEMLSMMSRGVLVGITAAACSRWKSQDREEGQTETAEIRWPWRGRR